MKKLTFLFVIAILAFTTLLCPGKKETSEVDGTAPDAVEGEAGTAENPTEGSGSPSSQ